jgi:hypothetical protein
MENDMQNEWRLISELCTVAHQDPKHYSLRLPDHSGELTEALPKRNSDIRG